MILYMVKSFQKSSFQEPVEQFRQKMVCSTRDTLHHNYDPGLTLTYFLARSNYATWAFILKNVTVMDSLKIISVCDLQIC